MKRPRQRLGKSVELVVDTREPKTIDGPLGLAGFAVYRQTLTTGDYLWVATDERSIAVERKTVTDLLSSVSGKQANGKSRLQNQMTRMVEEYDVAILLIEGALVQTPTGFVQGDGRTTGWYWDSIDNILVSLQRGGVTVARTGRGKVPDRLVSLVNYFDKRTHTLLPDSVGEGKMDVTPRKEAE